ncbi:hypothetical protein [Kitasatospora sp. NBC_01302]|uniref:hypothetical protein n=1 Tax=Kitasatospora sp. NBC_01302 TaxID=2903575 RepID=UPI002E0D1DE7|nr:hypothetical protein OG294_40890 [Kitasatospora sp. NBC_01302]
MIGGIGLFLLLVLGACVAGYVRGTFAKGPRAGSAPADDPAGGFASARQLHDRLSPHAVRAAGAQVRPGLPGPRKIEEPKRKGLLRGRR